MAIVLYKFSIGLIGLTGRETLYGSSGAGRWFIGSSSVLLISCILPLSFRYSPSILLIIIAEAREETLYSRREKVG
jgi:hypothetical protein